MSGTDTVSHSACTAVQNVDELLRLRWVDRGSGNILAVEDPARDSSSEDVEPVDRHVEGHASGV